MLCGGIAILVLDISCRKYILIIACVLIVLLEYFDL